MIARKFWRFVVFAAVLILSAGVTYADWQVFEQTTISSRIDGSIKRGFIFKTRTGHIYEVAEYVYLYEYEYSPKVIVLTDGAQFKLIIDGIDDPLLCNLLNGSASEKSQAGNSSRVTATAATAIESTITSEFRGLDNGNIYKLANGQVWQQTEFWIWTWIWVNPSVLIWQDGPVYMMKVENIDHAVMVERIK